MTQEAYLTQIPQPPQNNIKRFCRLDFVERNDPAKWYAILMLWLFSKYTCRWTPNAHLIRWWWWWWWQRLAELSTISSAPPPTTWRGYFVETWTREWLLIDCLYRVLADSGDYVIENPCWAVSISKHCVDGNLYKKRRRENKWACDR